MQVDTFQYDSKGGVKIFAKKWISPNPKAIIQISHGMAEHIDRYSHFAQELVKNNYSVYSNDHRGHGKTSENENSQGYFGDKNGWDLVVEDIHQLTNIIQKENPNAKIFIFGHSMGSYLTRRYVQLYAKDISGVVLSGTGYVGYAESILAQLAAKIDLLRGKKAKSLILKHLFSKEYLKEIKNPITDFDWLTRDQGEVKKYIEDPLCGIEMTTSVFRDVAKGIHQLNKNIKQTPIDLPMYILSGEKDPVGNYTKGVLKVHKAYQELPMKNLSYKIYKDARHEILNETNRREVYNDILSWLNKYSG